MNAARIAVVGGGLAGLTAALDCADAGAAVTLFEKRRQLGGATRSFRRNGAWFDNGQHVFLRCCTEYRALLERLGVAHLVALQDRLELPVLRPSAAPARLRRARLPAPLHLAGSILRYRHLPAGDRLRAVWAAAALRRLDPADPALDDSTFGTWLAAHHQSAEAVRLLWDVVCVPTVNLPAGEASLALAAMVFRTGLLDRADAGDVGWARVPLQVLHGTAGRRALDAAGVTVAEGTEVTAIHPRGTSFEVAAPGIDGRFDAVVLAVPHEAAARLLPVGSGVDAEHLLALGRSPIVDVHVVFDRQVTDLPFAAAVDSPVQFVFDRTRGAGIADGQYLALSVSAAHAAIGERPEVLVHRYVRARGELCPEARAAEVVDALVTREHAATFRGVPGTASRRPSAGTALEGFALAGAWTDTGWPATMEGAVRSGHAAARAVLAAVSNGAGGDREPVPDRGAPEEEVA